MNVADSIIPIFLLILLGWVLRRTGFVPAGFWQGAERLTYVVLLPALVVSTLAANGSAIPSALPAAAALAGAIIIVTVALIALQPLLGFAGPTHASVVQGAIRANTYVGLAIALSIWGQEGLTLATVAVAGFMPLVNIISVIETSRHAPGRSSTADLVVNVLTNPLIVACAIGIAVGLSGLPVPVPISESLGILAQGALAVGLLCVGAALDIRGLGGSVGAIVVSSVAKHAVMPAVAWGLCLLFGVGALGTKVIVMYAALPTATSSYILARQMGGNATAMAGIVSVQTALAVLVLPFVISLVN